jgi:hypothetical protein
MELSNKKYIYDFIVCVIIFISFCLFIENILMGIVKYFRFRWGRLVLNFKLSKKILFH